MGNPAEEVDAWVRHYTAVLALPTDQLRVTVSRQEFEGWLGRRVSSSLGGAYVYLGRKKIHAVLVNLPRLNPDEPRAAELVVAEELVHMRDWLDGDRRRHARHGYDRIAYRVSELTGATLEEIRNCLIPPTRRPAKYRYACPGCGSTWERRKTGTWSCSRCSPRFDRRFVLQLVEILDGAHG